ncbi:hypothetical protein D3C78_904760 [compost metagenome]
MTLDQPFGNSTGNFTQDLRAHGGRHDIRFGDQRYRLFTATVHCADVVDRLDPLLLADHVNLVAFTAVQQIQHRLVNIGKSQFGLRVRQQLADKTTPNISRTEM